MSTKNKTISGTDIEEVKRLNSKSGLTYNEAKAALASQKQMKQQKP
ncbi:hypothetical protein CR194_05560 [Salipaludibacillus keqinensis]|uniref:DNA mismatch repair protein MutT n=1 Tax=Salipaludibacillus keqinensis TaxID=2045207 RepID=A0A323TR29_9BACI|nr:hypothetical protein [Salipaludibacillus keqinensis]PYZ94983.1 hypothetical protein CR194_05560 [Salipaludibacillus keqinensis]